MYWLVVSRSRPSDRVVRGAMICAFGSKLAVRTAPAACARNSQPIVPAAGGEPMTDPLAPWAVVVMPDWLSTPRGSGAVPGERPGDDVLAGGVGVLEQLQRKGDDPGQGAGGERDSVKRHICRGGDGAVLRLPPGRALTRQPGEREGLAGHGDGDRAGGEHATGVAGQVDDPGRQGARDQRAAGADGRLGEGAFLGRVIPAACRHPAQVPVEAQPLGLLGGERAAGLEPVVHRLLAGQHGLAGKGAPGLADGGGPKLGDLAVTFGLDRVVDRTELRGSGLVLLPLLRRQVPGFGGGAGQDGIGSLAGGGALRPELLEKAWHGLSPGRRASYQEV